MEVWKPLQDYKDLYEVSNIGRIKSKHYNKTTILTGTINDLGYVRVKICLGGTYKSKLLHRLVLLTFDPTENASLQVNHKNGVKDDNRLENLEWCTPLENMLHAKETGLLAKNDGENNGRAKLNWRNVDEIRQSKLSGKELAG